MNKYYRGTVSNISLELLDNKAQEVMAAYRYYGFSGDSSGSVRITFNDGVPECLYFFDAPRSCKAADRKIKAKYANGDYYNY